MPSDHLVQALQAATVRLTHDSTGKHVGFAPVYGLDASTAGKVDVFAFDTRGECMEWVMSDPELRALVSPAVAHGLVASFLSRG